MAVSVKNDSLGDGLPNPLNWSHLVAWHGNKEGREESASTSVELTLRRAVWVHVRGQKEERIPLSNKSCNRLRRAENYHIMEANRD
jgi:hypothetical protein